MSLVSSQQLLQHHHCLTLLQIHSSARPFIQGLLATPPAAPEAVQLICKEVQQQPVVSRVGMDGGLRLSARPLQTFFAPSTAPLVMLPSRLPRPSISSLHFGSTAALQCQLSCFVLNVGDVGTEQETFQHIQLDSKRSPFK